MSFVPFDISQKSTLSGKNFHLSSLITNLFPYLCIVNGF